MGGKILKVFNEGATYAIYMKMVLCYKVTMLLEEILTGQQLSIKHHHYYYQQEEPEFSPSPGS